MADIEGTIRDCGFGSGGWNLSRGGGARGDSREGAFLLEILEFFNLRLKLSNCLKPVDLSRGINGGVTVSRSPNVRWAWSFSGGRQGPNVWRKW